MKATYLTIIASILLLGCKPMSIVENNHAGHEIKGIDVSHHQGNIDWKSISEDGIDYVYIKATEGASYVDPKFLKNATDAHKYGILVGAYHFFRMTSTPEEQFKSFKKQIDKAGIDLIPMVDVETSDGYSRRIVQERLLVLLNLLEKEYGTKPMIYGTNRSYNELCAPEFNSYPLYIGRYGDNRPIVTGQGHYTIWQFTENGKVNGCEKPIDLCRFHPECGIEDIILQNAF